MYDVTEFGAKAGSDEAATEAIQDAIDAAAGGGTVSVPAGRYRTGSLHLRSGVTLRVERGAVIEGSPDLDDYEDAGDPDHHDRERWHLLWADGAEDVALVGGGRIDGNGHAFWKTEDPEVVSSERRPDLSEAERTYYLEMDRRPSPMVEFTGCRDVHVEGITLKDSPGWTLHLEECTGARVRDVDIDAPKIGPNTDGIDVTASSDVMVAGCRISCGDDAVCLKTSYESSPCERVTVSDCVLESRTCGVKIGTESWADIRDVTVSNCVIHDSERGLGIHAYDGGTVENVVFADLSIETGGTAPSFSERAIHVDVYRRGEAGKRSRGIPVDGDRGLSAVRNVRFEDIVIRSPGRTMVTAPSDAPIKDVTVVGVTHRVTDEQDLSRFAETTSGQFCNDPEHRTLPGYVALAGVDGATVRDVTVRGATGVSAAGKSGVYAAACDDLAVEGLSFDAEGAGARLELVDSSLR